MSGNSEISQEELDNNDRKRLVTDTLMYILGHESSKFVVKKLDLMKHFQYRNRCFKTVMFEVEEILLKVFGYHLISFENKFFLVNDFPQSLLGDELLDFPQEIKARNVLLLIVLSLIFMEGGELKEDDLWVHLKRLDILKDGELCDPYFGENVKKVITKDFVNMMYLDCRQKEGTNPAIYEFVFNERAKEEVSKRRLLDFVCKMYGDCCMERWSHQLKEIEKEEKEKEEKREKATFLSQSSGPQSRQSVRQNPQNKQTKRPSSQRR